MGFTVQEIDQMQKILKQLEPKTIESIQLFALNCSGRTGCTFFVKEKWQVIYVFQYFENLSIYRKKLIIKLAKKIPYPLHQIEFGSTICIGWKCR